MTDAATVQAQPLAPDARFARPRDTSFAELAGEVLVMEFNDRRSHRLLETAAFIWLRAIAGRPVATILDEVCAEYDVTREQAQSDIESAIASFLAAKILEPA